MKVTRSHKSKGPRKSKLLHLKELAKRLGTLRSDIWQEFGSLKGVGIKHRAIRDQWLLEGRRFNVPSRLWKETLRVVIDDIRLSQGSAKVRARKEIRKRYVNDDAGLKMAYRKLKSNEWTKDHYLRRVMRKYFKRGHTTVSDQIVLDTDCYSSSQEKGRTWPHVTCLNKGKRMSVPFNTVGPITGTVRLITRDDLVEVHQSIEETSCCSVRPAGVGTVGIDKGYTETFTDSDGTKHGEGLGELLSSESDFLKVKWKHRNQLRAIATNKPWKKDAIEKNNLGRKKLNARKEKHRSRVTCLISQSAHSVCDKADRIGTEDLTSVIRTKNNYGKDQSRRLSGWVKGVIARSMESISRRRGASLIVVNAAYTSQTCHACGHFGVRKGDLFYCSMSEVVQDADHNAAINIKLRINDPEISRWAPYKRVKGVLLSRLSPPVGSAQPGH
jgi:hypothetical protein